VTMVEGFEGELPRLAAFIGDGDQFFIRTCIFHK